MTKVPEQIPEEEPLSEPFWKGCAMVIEGESLKASRFVNHNASLGGLREKIIRRQLIDQVHGKFKVETGIAYDPGQARGSRIRCPMHSKQLDIVIHDHMNWVPFYRWDDFVVVHHFSVKATVEIKSHLDKKGFIEIIQVYDSFCDLEEDPYDRARCFAYALDGVRFETFRGYLSGSQDEVVGGFVGNHRFPIAIACQSENYIMLRPARIVLDNPLYSCAVRSIDKQDGICTGMFINSITSLLESLDRLSSYAVYQWYNDLPKKFFEKFYLDTDGVWQSGNITFGY